LSFFAGRKIQTDVSRRRGKKEEGEKESGVWRYDQKGKRAASLERERQAKERKQPHFLAGAKKKGASADERYGGRDGLMQHEYFWKEREEGQYKSPKAFSIWAKS